MTPAEYQEAGVLTARQAEVYRYHYVQGCSYSKVGLMLGITKESVRDHWKKAQSRIHDYHLKETA